MKKKLATILAGTVLISPIALMAPDNVNPTPIHKADAKSKVLSKHTLSKSQVKSIAKSSQKNKNNVSKWGSVLSGLFGQYGVPVGASVLASSEAQQRTINVFKKAAKQNKRVQVIVKSGPTPNLNKVSYKIV
ncbi:hypothetical protein [Staphylococcus pasteuri]|uniref:hypothetical protein n=1 Tax=Staphylococcus pasteuri TaxID=45972 RepID=UPI003260FBC0